jgi:hypothetical protein
VDTGAGVVSPTVARGVVAAAAAAVVVVVGAAAAAAAVAGVQVAVVAEENFLQARELLDPHLNMAADFPGGLHPANTDIAYVGYCYFSILLH